MNCRQTCVAIDFETANSDRSSACALGIAVIEGEKIVKRTSWLIRPRVLYFDPYNIYIHGITEEEVRDKPEFNDLWDDFRRYIEGSLLIAHNASFDISVLRHVLDQYGIPYPTVDYLCTRLIAKNVWANLWGYGLSTVCEYLGLEFTHHDPEEDSVASAQVALRAMHEVGVPNLEELCVKIRIGKGQLYPGGYKPCRGHTYQRPSALRPTALRTTTGEFDPGHPFFGKSVVFTGALQYMVRTDAMQKVVDCGGSCTNTVGRGTNFLVLGDLDFSRLKGGVKDTASSKLVESDLINAAVRQRHAEDAESLAAFEERDKEPNLAFEAAARDLRRRGKQ